MADEADRSQQDIEFLLQVTKPNLKKEAEPTGFCLFCGEEVKEINRRWCDAVCRDLWQRQQINRK